MIKSSNAGVDKVVYMDPSVNRDSTFALGSLDGLNRDLHAMSKLGVVAGGDGSWRADATERQRADSAMGSALK